VVDAEEDDIIYSNGLGERREQEKKGRTREEGTDRFFSSFLKTDKKKSARQSKS
jgi:hypothetical protein